LRKLNEPIQVMARFRDGRVAPTHFLWRGRTHKVSEVTGRWSSREGAYQVHQFTVVSQNGTYFELSLNTRTMDWRLDRVELE